MVVEDCCPHWRPAASGIPQALLIGPLLFVGCMISEFADDSIIGDEMDSEG